MRVNNTEQRQVTYWDLDKFDTRLEQMRELYTVRHTHTHTHTVWVALHSISNVNHSSY